MVLDTIQRLKQEGIGIFLISHDMADVFEVCDRVTVMKNGSVDTVRIADVTPDEVLAMIIPGRNPREGLSDASARGGRHRRSPAASPPRPRCRTSSTRPTPRAAEPLSTATGSTWSAAAWPRWTGDGSGLPSLFIAGGANRSKFYRNRSGAAARCAWWPNARAWSSRARWGPPRRSTWMATGSSTSSCCASARRC